MLKVGSPQPQMDAMPPMGDPMMGGDMPPMDDPNGGMPPMDDPNAMGADMSGSSEFDTNFDAGVDADENTDPKKYIQQLTGKLSQSLRKYNENLPQPESDLCKYVAGMILKQTTEGLTDAEKKEIIDKVNGNATDDNMDDGMDIGGDITPMDGQNTMGGEQNQAMMESINHKQLVNEIFQELIQNKDNTQYTIKGRPVKDIGFRKKPFTSPKLR